MVPLDSNAKSAAARAKRPNPASIAKPNAAFAKALVEYTGLERYCAIMAFEGNVSDKENGFQKLFNGYYNIRRPAEWREKYYALFQEMRAAEKVDFSLIVSRLHKMTRKVEPSFTSKLLATIDDAAPVWDRRVISALKHYDPKLPVVPTEFAGGQIERGIAGYQALQEACRDLLAEPIGKRCIEQFDCYLSDYSAISNMKKLDVVLWCAGN